MSRCCFAWFRWPLLVGVLSAFPAEPGVAEGPVAPRPATVSAPLPPAIAGFLERYCAECHGPDDPQAGLSVAAFADRASLLKSRKAWDRLLQRVRNAEMPPDDAVQPPAAERAAFDEAVRELVAEVARTAERDPGRVTVRRLNRAEYDNTIRDLLHVDLKPAADFPTDDVGHGFDNIGDVLTLSPVLMERYLAAAETVVERAVLTEIPAPPRRALQGRFLHPYPHEAPGTQGRFRPLRPTDKNPVYSGPLVGDAAFLRLSADADLILRARFYARKTGDAPAYAALFISGSALVDPSPDEEVNRLMGEALKTFKPLRILKTVELTSTDEMNPQEVEFPISRRGDIARAGVAVVRPPEGQEPPLLFVEHIASEGPLETRPLSHRLLLACTPGLTPGEQTREVLTRFLSRAFRRPATAAEVQRFSGIVESTMAGGGTWEAGIRLAMQAALVSPKFLFRFELDDRPASAEPRPLDEFQLASRLSYFLWSSMPDNELTDLAARGQLTASLPAQVRRMLQDPKAAALIDHFALQWLQLGRLPAAAPDAALFPAFNEPLRAAMLEETRLFLRDLMREDRSVLDLVSADFTYLNEPLARHYGIADTQGNKLGQPPTRPGGQPIKGPKFVRVGVAGTERGGLLTQAAILTVTSNPTRTSPVKRGRWILEQVLGTPPPPPPPNVPGLDKNDGQPLTGTLRQRMEQHRRDPACASCHASMDAIGFALENFDATGGLREKDGDFAIDPSGVLPDGATFRGPAELKAILLERHELFVRCLVGKMLTYALGRGLDYYDEPAIDRVAAAMARDGNRFSTLVLEIASSEPFRFRRGKE